MVGSDGSDWFRDVTLFKVNPACGGREPFVAYSNGKSAIRLRDGLVPSGSHRFTALDHVPKLLSRWVTPCATQYAIDCGESCLEQQHRSGDGEMTAPGVMLSAPCLLHFPCCDYGQWRLKYTSASHIAARANSAFGFADVYSAGSSKTKELISIMARFEEAIAASADGGVASSQAETASAEAEAALREAYCSSVVYDGERAAECLAAGRLVRTDRFAKLCTAAVELAAVRKH